MKIQGRYSFHILLKLLKWLWYQSAIDRTRQKNTKNIEELNSAEKDSIRVCLSQQVLRESVEINRL